MNEILTTGTVSLDLPRNELGAGQSDPASLPFAWMLTGQPHENASALRVAITKQPYAIGRDLDNDLCLSNPSVSGHHAELVFVADDIYVRDLDSTNGTLLNGRRVRTLTGLRDGDILHFGSAMFTLQRAEQKTGRDTVATSTAEEAIAQIHFDKLIKRPAVRPFFQPIVRLEDNSRIGYEILSRSQLIGLETPEKMFRVAAQRTSEVPLSQVCRSEGLRVAQLLHPGLQYYLNTHPKEIETPELLDSLSELRSDYPDLAFMLEVHESAITSTDYLRDLRKRLNDLNIGLAYDDFGAGQARIAELAEVPPDVVKFDIKLIRDLESASPQRRSTVESLVRIVQNLGIVPLAEGIEKPEEADTCRELGFVLAQGYLFGKPAPAKRWIETDGPQVS